MVSVMKLGDSFSSVKGLCECGKPVLAVIGGGIEHIAGIAAIRGKSRQITMFVELSIIDLIVPCKN